MKKWLNYLLVAAYCILQVCEMYDTQRVSAVLWGLAALVALYQCGVHLFDKGKRKLTVPKNKSFLGGMISTDAAGVLKDISGIDKKRKRK